MLELLISSEGCVVAAEEFVTATVEEAVAFSFLGFTVAAGCFLGVVTVTVFVSVPACFFFPSYAADARSSVSLGCRPRLT